MIAMTTNSSTSVNALEMFVLVRFIVDACIQ